MDELLKLFDVRDVLLHMLNVVVLFVAIRLLLYKPVRRFMQARTQRVQGEADEAAARQQEAAQALADARAQGEAVQREAAAAAAQAEQKAQQAAQDMLVQAQERAQHMLDKAQADAAKTQAAAEQAIQQQAVAMAMGIAERILAREVSSADNDALVRDYLTKVG